MNRRSGLIILVVCSLILVPTVMAAPPEWANFPWNDLVLKYLPMWLSKGVWTFDTIIASNVTGDDFCLTGDNCISSWPVAGVGSKWLNITLPIGEGGAMIDLVYPNTVYGDHLLVFGSGFIQNDAQVAGRVIASGGFVGDNMTTSAGDITFHNSSGSGLMATMFDNGNFTALGQICDVNGCLQNVSSATYLPVNIETRAGTYDAGNVTSTWVARDDFSYNVSEDGGATPVLEIAVNWTGITDFNTILMRVWYEGGLGHEIAIGLWDLPLQIYEEEYGDITDTGGFVFINIPVADAAAHINTTTGNVSLRFRHEQNGINTHNFYVDYIALVDGFTTQTTSQHDALSGRDDIENHPWAFDTAGSRTVDFINITGDIVAGDETGDQLLIVNGNRTDPGIAFASNEDTGMSLAGGPSLLFSVDGQSSFGFLTGAFAGMTVYGFGTSTYPWLRFATDIDTGIYNPFGAPFGDSMVLQAGGFEFIRMEEGLSADTNVTMNANNITLTGNTTIFGNTTVVGNLVVTVNITAENINASGQVCDSNGCIGDGGVADPPTSGRTIFRYRENRMEIQLT